MDRVSMDIGKVISIHRKRRKWDQADLAQKVGRSPQVISNWECKISEPKLMDLFKLSIVLELSADYLIGLTNHPKNTSPINTPAHLEDLLSEPSSLHWGDKLLTKEQQDKIMKLLLLVLDTDTGTNKEDQSG